METGAVGEPPDFEMKATFRAFESGPLAFEQAGWRAMHVVELLAPNAPITFVGLSPHPDAA